MVTTAHAIRRSLVIRERAKVEGKGKRDWLHNDYPASRGLSLAWLFRARSRWRRLSQSYSSSRSFSLAWLLAFKESLASLVSQVVDLFYSLGGVQKAMQAKRKLSQST